VPTLAEDRDAIRDLFARYCLYIDTGAADEWAATFTEDGEFLRAGADPLTGREALKAFATSLSSSTLHHMVLNEIIDIDGDTATCRSSVFVTSKGASVSTGRSEDALRRIDGSWRIARRSYEPDRR
jgi:uncharacterized protein (TIGR02246 family)